MARKILIGFVLIVILALTLNFILSRLASQAVHEGLERFIEEQEQETVNLSFEETTVSTLRSRFTIRGLEIEQTASGETTQIGELSASISYRDFIDLIASRSSGDTPEIRRGVLVMNEVTHTQNGGPGYSFDHLSLSIDGNLGDLMRAIDTGFRIPPVHNQNAEVEILNFQPFYDVNFDLLNTGFTVPLPTINRIFIDGTYDTETDQLTISQSEVNMDRSDYSMQLTIDDLSTFYSGGRADNTEPVPLVRATVSGTTTERGRMGLIPGGLGIHYESLELTYEGPFHRGGSFREIFFSDETVIGLDAREVTLYSPEHFRRNYGQALRFLGISDEQITVPGITAQYTIRSDRAQIDEFSLNNPFARVSVSGALLMHEEQSWSWEDAVIRIEPSTNESRNFIETVKSFFDLAIPEENGIYEIRIRGTLDEPRLDGITS